MVHQIQFEFAIRGHHVYKSSGTPSIGESLKYRKDHKEEAKDYDIHAIGVYLQKALVDHIPIRNYESMNSQKILDINYVDF